MARRAAWFVIVILLAAAVVADQWRVLDPAAAPSPRAGLTLSNVAGRVLLYGGRSATTPFRELWEWKPTADLLNGTWVKLTPGGPTPDSSFVHAAVAYGGKLYVFHGFNASFQVTSGVWVFAPASNSWAAAPSTGQVPPGRWGHRVVVLGDRGYLLGGALASSQLATDVYSYHFPTGAWRKEAPTRVDGGVLAAAPTAPDDFAGIGRAALALPGGIGNGDTDVAALWGGEGTAGVRDLTVALGPTNEYLTWTMSEDMKQHSRRAWQSAVITQALAIEVGGQTPGGVTKATTLHNFETWLNRRAWRLGAAPRTGAPLPLPSREGGFAFLSSSPFAPGPTPTPGPGPTPTPLPDHLTGIYFGGRDGSNNFLSTTMLYTSDSPASDSTPDWQVPVVANLSGSGGVFFSSQVWGYNGTGDPLQIRAVYTPREDIGGTARSATFFLAPGKVTHYPNVLRDILGLSPSDRAAGTLNLHQIAPLPRGSYAGLFFQSTVTARRPDGSEYGQSVPVTRRDEAVPAGFSVVFPATTDAQHNRVNVAAAAFRPADITLQLFSDSNQPLGAPKTLTLAAGASVQLNDVFKQFDVPPQNGATVQFSVLSGLAQGYVSVLDGGTPGYTGTSDPATMPWSWDGDERVTMFELGSVTGLNEFKGSATIRNHSAAPATVRLDFHERGKPGVAATTQIVIPPGSTFSRDDFVGAVFNLPGKVGTVVCTSLTGARIAAAGREFAVFRDGAGKQVGTAGQLVPGLTDRDLLRPGWTYAVLNLKQTGTTAGSERSHFAAFNPGPHDATVTLRMYDDDGPFEGERSWLVRAGEEVRINFVAGAIKPSQDGRRKHLLITSTWPVHALVFRVNGSGDPITVRPTAVGQF